MDFITLDFETATPAWASPCEIGLTFVRGGELMETRSWLIRPRFNEYSYHHIQVHGITPEETEHSPEFDFVWEEVGPLLENQFVIAHNARFDMSVMEGAMKLYRMPLTPMHYACSVMFSRRIWPGLQSYGLKPLCERNGIRFHHHRAGSDSRATAELVIKAFREAEIHSLHDFRNKLQIRPGRLEGKEHQPCKAQTRTASAKLPPIQADRGKSNPRSIFYGKSVVFDGLWTAPRKLRAQQAVVNIGGIISDKLSLETDFLVSGPQQVSLFGDTTPSKEQLKAGELIHKGARLQMLSESEFLQNLSC